MAEIGRFGAHFTIRRAGLGVESFRSYMQGELFVFVMRDIDGTFDFVTSRVEALGVAHARYVVLEHPTAGQAETVAYGLDAVPAHADEPLMIFNIDTIRPGLARTPRASRKCDGWLEVFSGDGDGWLFVLPTAKTDIVTRMTEKIRISNLCCTGLYEFSHVSLFREAFHVECANRSAKELYFAPVYNHLIAAGRTIRFRQIAGALGRVSVASLEKLLHLGYREVRMEHDLSHQGSYTPSQRDNAESARGTILSALVERPGAESYEVLRRAASHSDFLIRASRFRQIAKEKVEKDAECPAWLPAEIVAMEMKHVAPVKTRDDLFRVVNAVLSDIKFALAHADASSRVLLERAQDEDEVQKWLLEHLNLRANGRYHAHREAEVAEGDKPDIIVGSTSAKVEVAIEIKHGGKGWTLRQLEDALHKQLTVDYLKPATRRYGLLVVSQHTKRRWLEIGSRAPISFDQVIKYLSGKAAGILHNGYGAVKVGVIGINAWIPKAYAEAERCPPTKAWSSKKNARVSAKHTAAVAGVNEDRSAPSGAKHIWPFANLQEDRELPRVR